MVRVYHEELCFAIVIYCFSIIRCCFIVMLCCLICLLFCIYPRSQRNEADALIGTGLNVSKKLLIFNTTLQTRASLHRVVRIPNCKGSSRRDLLTSHFHTIVMFMVDKPVDKTPIIFTVSSTRVVLEALVDKPVDKTSIISTVSSTRAVLEALGRQSG